MKTKMLFYEKIHDPNNGDFIIVTLLQVGFPFSVLVIGILISMAILAVEIYWRNRSSRTKTFEYDGNNPSFGKVANRYLPVRYRFIKY